MQGGTEEGHFLSLVSRLECVDCQKRDSRAMAWQCGDACAEIDADMRSPSGFSLSSCSGSKPEIGAAPSSLPSFRKAGSSLSPARDVSACACKGGAGLCAPVTGRASLVNEGQSSC